MTEARPVPVPAVDERAAGGETARLFADIRRALGVPVVNLVWRHLATVPGALPWAWDVTRPFYSSGAAAREGAALVAALPLPPLPAWSGPAFRTAAGDAVGKRAVIVVLDSYVRSNVMNLLAFTALGRRLRDPAVAPTAPGRAVAPAVGADLPRPEGTLPPLLTLAELAPAVAEQVRRLERLGARGDGDIPASLYRHLAHWPGILTLTTELLAPLHDDGRLDRLIADARDLATAAAARAIDELGGTGSALAPAARSAVETALIRFTGGVIPRMVPISVLLRRAVPA